MSEEARAEEARNAGRGGIFVLGAKVFFIVIGFLQQALLNRAIGLAEYGALARVLAPANIVNNVVVQGSIQGVSRRVAPVREHFRRELAASLRVHVPLAFAVALGFFLLAEPIARFQKAPHIVTPLRVMALVALAYGIYAPLVGVLNGRTRFDRQAGLDVIFAVLRTAGLIGVGYVFVRRGFGGAFGATIGFALAAACIVPLGFFAARAPDRNVTPTAATDAPTIAPGPYLAGLGAVALAQVLVNALMQADITIVGRYLSAGALSAGLEGEAARVASDQWVGVYRACQLFAFLPYQLVLSVAQVLFPMVARAHAEGDRERVATIVSRGMRIAALLAGMLVSVVVALPGTLLRFAYDSEIAARGADTLRVLAIGQGAFALFAIASTVLVSLRRERTSALLSAAALAFVGAGSFAFASRASFGADQLGATALATALGLLLALGLAAATLKRAAGAFVPAVTFIRVAIGIALLAVVGRFVPTLPRLVAPLAAGAVVTAYVVLMIVSRELGREDGAALVRIVRRKKSPAADRAAR